MNVTPTTADDTCSPVATHAIGQEAASSVAATLKALSDPLRLRMLSAIASDPRGESCVCDPRRARRGVAADRVSPPQGAQRRRCPHLRAARNLGLVPDYPGPAPRGHGIAGLVRTRDGRALERLRRRRGAAPRLRRARHPSRPGACRGGSGAGFRRRAHDRRESYTALARSARVTSALVPLTERFARQRLADLTRDRDAAVPQVLFVCVANAGRSQLPPRSSTSWRPARSWLARQDRPPRRHPPARPLDPRGDRRRPGRRALPEASHRRRRCVRQTSSSPWGAATSARSSPASATTTGPSVIPHSLRGRASKPSATTSPHACAHSSTTFFPDHISHQESP